MDSPFALLLPELISEDAWQPFAPLVLPPGRPLAIADLLQCELSESGFFPDFGHTTRYETARGALLTNYAAEAGAEAERLVVLMAGKIRGVTVKNYPEV